MIVAVMSSLPSAGVDVSRPTIRPMSDSASRAPVMSPRMSAGVLAALEQPAQRVDGRSRSKRSGFGAAPLAGQEHEGVAGIDERAHGAGDPLLGRDGVDPRRVQARLDVRHRGSRQLVEQGVTVGEVAVHRGPRDPGRVGHVVHARLLALDGEDLGGSIEDRRGDALLQRWSAGRFGHRRLVVV